ncbi:MAG: hypothetical protein ACXWTK_03640 [Methylobacter sp.]
MTDADNYRLQKAGYFTRAAYNMKTDDLLKPGPSSLLSSLSVLWIL